MAAVYESTVTVENAAWIRLYFSTVELDAGSYVRMTSAFDNDVQELDAAGIAMWGNTSAYFNGDTVHLELIAGPKTAGNRVVLDQVAVHPVDEQETQRDCEWNCGICGSDDRVPSDEDWSGRLMPVGCTGSIYNEDSCAVSAGHCIMSGLVIQFNVPDSNSDCSTNNPPAADQFPITSHSYSNEGVGDDWAVMTTGTNNLGETPYERYGAFRSIATSGPVSEQSLDVWGYGIDDQCTRSQRQQTSSGQVTVVDTDYFLHSVDATCGNSGSAIIRSNQILGIVTHCQGVDACPPWYNIATRADLAAFATARDSLCGAGGYCYANSDSTDYEYISRVQVGSIDNTTGSNGYYDYTYLSTGMEIGTGYGITVTITDPYSTDIGGLWVDWNQDEDFSDADETITTSWSGVGPYSTTITPPAGAALGSTRMRVRIQDGDYDSTLSSCGTTSYGEVEDYTVNVTQTQEDTTPPSPDPMSFSTVPYPLSTSAIRMTATTASDDTPPIYYQFDFVSGGSGGTDSSYQSSTTYTDYDLVANTAYAYRVRARDSAPSQNATAYSTPSSTTATHIQTPTGVSLGTVTSNSIQLNVTGTLTNLTVGSSGVYFDSTTPGGDGGINNWVQVTTDTATGLSPDTAYAFQVKARNQSGVETSYSSTSSEVTLAAVPGAPALTNVTASTIDLNVAPNGNPSITEFAIQCSSSNPADATWDLMYVDASGNASVSEVWQTDAAWGTVTVQGLTAETEYSFHVKARNQDGVETAFGLESSATTTTSGGDIPAVSEWGLVTMTLLVLTAGTLVFVGRRKVA